MPPVPSPYNAATGGVTSGREAKRRRTDAAPAERSRPPKTRAKAVPRGPVKLIGPLWKCTYSMDNGPLAVAWYTSEIGADVYAKHWELHPATAIHGVQRMASDEEVPSHAIEARGSTRTPEAVQ